jgi:NAD(P)-dependent dehydrogenase (short-subunit alcohol dehydrogenase family)
MEPVNLNSKVFLITGATDGIGKATALELARMGAVVCVHGRSLEKARQVVDEIRRATGNAAVEYFLADFASLAQIRALARIVQEKHNHLDALINNAGVISKTRQITQDGLERTFQVNHLAPFLLTNLLLDSLRASGAGRVVTVSSGMHASAELDWNNLQGEKHYEGYAAYSLSKLCNVLFTFALARRLGGTPVTANCLNPGVVDTNMLRMGWGGGGASPAQGAQTSVYLAASPEVAGVTGTYYAKSHPAQPAAASTVVDTQERLWKVSAELTGLAEL